ncbi:hypothetical protein [Heyndrickxia vini]|uniref:Carotenoid biosynthesis protein n=1 Tax=Heyndrickxia vini TaxID=1476025 RepID=A0ABX7DZM4_9BACI|nr:hypothetical protein [Heyndrickxia vini]QQZ08449.1 hypothetical protein I5776_15445 [Heyndrickxia vini]
MSLKSQWILNGAMIIFSWLTVPFLGKRNIKRFFLASILIVIFESISAYRGKKRKWWIFYNKPHSFLTGEFPFNIGPFLVGSMWILKFTFGKFKRFILVNAIIDGFFTFPLMIVFKKLKIVKLHRINHLQFFLYIFYKSFILYGIQYIIDLKRKLT